MSPDLDSAIIQACAAMSDFLVLMPVARALEQAWKAEKQPAERTPEVVLRAMLKAYEAAALEIDVAYFRTDDGTPAEAVLGRASERADSALSNLRDATAASIVGNEPDIILRMWGLWPDYEARLSGARPIDAPPLEEP